MNDHSWIYQNSHEGIYREDYLQEVECFINFVLYKLKNINVGEIGYPCVNCKNKKFHNTWVCEW